MRRILRYIRQRLSLRLGLLLVLIITVIFSLVLDFLFYQSKQYVQQVAITRANLLLDNTVVRINGIMDETETVTNYMAIVTPQHLHPDSLLAFTRRTVANHSFLTGFAISMEPYFFPEMGRYFSAYSLRQDDSITTVREGPFEYFDKIWYNSSRTQGKPCWVDAYDDYNKGTLSSRDILTSYCCPLRDSEGHFVGSITASLTLKWLSDAVTTIHPYPNSSAIMIGRTGTYLVHPDTAKLFHENIFSDAAPESKRDIDFLGRSMLAGHSGMIETVVNGQKAFIFYRPLERTGWSIAIVCPASDVFSRYNQLLIIVWTIIGVGLLLLLLFCYQSVRRAVQPLHQLADITTRMADCSDFTISSSLPPSTRRDSIGRLTNSFILMHSSLAETVSDIHRANNELEQRNQELIQAYNLKVEAERQKAAFIREMFHQIRTPLNIISGFTQVLSSSYYDLPDEEVKDITDRMSSSAKAISHISRMLAVAAADKHHLTLTTFLVKNLLIEAADTISSTALAVHVDASISATCAIRTDRKALLFILTELLDNARKFAPVGPVTLGCHTASEECQESGSPATSAIIFTVTDCGPGIPATAHDSIFSHFTKLNTFTEGVGLGLPLCRITARQLGGDLCLDSDYHNGSRFILTLTGIINSV